MAKQVSKPVPKPKRTHVMLSVRVDVPTNARIAAAAALAGIDKSTYCLRAIVESLQGIVVFDRKRSGESVDLPDGLDRTDAA